MADIRFDQSLASAVHYEQLVLAKLSENRSPLSTCSFLFGHAQHRRHLQKGLLTVKDILRSRSAGPFTRLVACRPTKRVQSLIDGELERDHTNIWATYHSVMMCIYTQIDLNHIPGSAFD